MCFSILYLSYDSTKPYVMGTQKNRLIERILLSTHNIGFKYLIRVLKFRRFCSRYIVFYTKVSFSLKGYVVGTLMNCLPEHPQYRV